MVYVERDCIKQLVVLPFVDKRFNKYMFWIRTELEILIPIISPNKKIGFWEEIFKLEKLVLEIEKLLAVLVNKLDIVVFLQKEKNIKMFIIIYLQKKPIRKFKYSLI